MIAALVDDAQLAGSPLLISDFVTIGHAVILHGCSIGNECLIGMGSIVMDDAIIQDRVMVGAGSLVPAGQGGTSTPPGGNRVPALFRRALCAGQK